MVGRDLWQLNYYERLGVPEGATREEIMAAFKALRAQFHPDTKPESYRAHFDDMMKGINEAHDILRDPLKRRRYDDRLKREKTSGGASWKESPAADSSGARPRTRQREDARTRGRRDSFGDRGERRRKSRARSSGGRREGGRGWRRDEPFGGPRTPEGETYASLLNSYVLYLRMLDDHLENVREALFVQWPTWHEEIDAALAEGLAYPWVRGNPAEERRMKQEYMESRRTLDQNERSVRHSCERVLQDFRENTHDLLEGLDKIERRTLGLPTDRRAELRAVQERLEVEAVALARGDTLR